MLSMKERQAEAAKNAEPKLTNEDIKALADKALEYIPKELNTLQSSWVLPITELQ